MDGRTGKIITHFLFHQRESKNLLKLAEPLRPLHGAPGLRGAQFEKHWLRAYIECNRYMFSLAQGSVV